VTETNEQSAPAGEMAQRQPAAAQKSTRGSFFKNPVFIGILILALAAGLFWGYRYWQDLQTRVAIDTAEISAPVILVSPEVPGTLKTLFVKEGESVVAGQQLFSVGERVTSARTPGIITAVQNTPGQFASQQSVIVQMYDPSNLRIVGHVQEDQGLADLRVGQKVIFTVDAFDNREYAGTLDSIANVADQGSITFSISDKRQEKLFSVKAIFDPSAYPELRNGMSARMWVYKK
jgi:multidrug resistance efflux pump